MIRTDYWADYNRLGETILECSMELHRSPSCQIKKLLKIIKSSIRVVTEISGFEIAS